MNEDGGGVFPAVWDLLVSPAGVEDFSDDLGSGVHLPPVCTRHTVGAQC